MQMPIVVEQDFRENFSIASATPAYQRLLAAAPGEFAGSVSRLAAIVELLSEGVKRAFAEQGLPLPPWRRAKSVMSKWGMGPNAHGVASLPQCRLYVDQSCPGDDCDPPGCLPQCEHVRKFALWRLWRLQQ